MKRFDYPVLLAHDEVGGIVASCRDLPSMQVTCSAIDQTIAGVIKAIEDALTVYMTEGLPLPLPSKIAMGEIYLAPRAAVAVKTALYVAMAGSGITKVQLAKQLGVDEKEVRRLLDPTYQSKLPRLAQAVDLLGYRLVIGLEPLQPEVSL